MHHVLRISAVAQNAVCGVVHQIFVFAVKNLELGLVCVRVDHCQIEKHFYAFLPIILADYSILCLTMQSEERIYRLLFSWRKNF